MVAIMPRMTGKKNKQAPQNRIAVNKKARFDFLIEENFEAGLALQGWEVKSLRAGRVQISGKLRTAAGR